MIRTLASTGLIAAFIACAFVPPTDANFRSLTESAKQQVKARTVASLLEGASIDPATVASAKAALQKVAPDPKKVIKRVVSVAKVKVTSMAWKKFKEVSATESIVERLEGIEWAVRKSSVRLCGELTTPADAPLIPGGPTEGDYLALCLAKVTGDILRCDQISEKYAPELKKLCTEELAT